jgi:hypothetical protein
MMNRFLYFLVILFFCPGVSAQTPGAVHLADSLLRAGTFKAAVTVYDFPKEIKDLQQKALSNLKKNKQRANTYLVTMVGRGDKDIPKTKDYGLTSEELDKMLTGFKAGHSPFYSDTSTITIKKEKGLITFKTSGKLALFNYLRIDTKEKHIYFDNLKVTRELKVYGKFYAPGLIGIETHWDEKIGPLKNKEGITSFSLTVGTSKGHTKPVFCLLYIIPTGDLLNQPRPPVIMTIL